MVKKGDFIEIEYTGKLKEEGFIFDTTDKAIADKEGIGNPDTDYGPATVCVGENILIEGLDEDVIGKELNKEYTVDVPTEKGFGKKNAKLIQLVSASKFKKQDINPVPGLQVQVDNQMGLIKVVTGGRVMVDFNHPLSGKELIYTYKINKIVEDIEEKVKAYFKVIFRIKDIKVEKKENVVEIETKNEMPEMLQKEFEKKLKEVISDKLAYKFTSAEKSENK